MFCCAFYQIHNKYQIQVILISYENVYGLLRNKDTYVKTTLPYQSLGGTQSKYVYNMI